jgi:Response regulators consisting of a CheY-like receiver domain and a winged-helix DNA-binding domain
MLIIEDQKNIAMVLEEIFKDEGYSVVRAADGISGLQRLKEAPKVDIVILDLHIPGKSGREVVEAMRFDEALKDIPVIITTGDMYNDQDFPPKGSFQAVVYKPFDLNDIIEKVKGVLEWKY